MPASSRCPRNKQDALGLTDSRALHAACWQCSLERKVYSQPCASVCTSMPVPHHLLRMHVMRGTHRMPASCSFGSNNLLWRAETTQ